MKKVIFILICLLTLISATMVFAGLAAFLPTPSTDKLLLSDGVSYLLLSDGTSRILLAP